MKHTYLSSSLYINKKSDPFFLREVLLVISGLFILLEYLGSSHYYAGSYNPFYSLLSLQVFFLIFYAASVSASIAKETSSGQLGFLFVSPIPRRYYLFLSALFPALSISILFLIPAGILQYIIYNGIYWSILLLLFLLLFVSAFLYISVGLLISIILKSQIFSTFTIIVGFILGQIYAFIYFPKNNLGQFLMAGYGQISSFTENLNVYSYGALIYLVMSLIILFALYPLLIRIGIKSGRP